MLAQAIKRRLSKEENQKGFTLIELLAVIVILGIIAVIAIPLIGNVINNSKKVQMLLPHAKCTMQLDYMLLV